MIATTPRPLNEAERLAALESYRILDTAAERSYDDISAVAAQLCGAPIALVSLVDRERQWFKSRVGLAAAETPRDIAFCAHAIMKSQTMVVEDAQQDSRFSDNPLVTGDPHIRFYAGAPLTDKDGFGLGSLCVIDTEPRRLSERQTLALEALARLVVDQLETRRATFQLAEALDRVRLLDDLVPVCSYCRRVRNDKEYWQNLDAYIHEKSGADVTHGICPDCLHIELGKAEK